MNLRRRSKQTALVGVAMRTLWPCTELTRPDPPPLPPPPPNPSLHPAPPLPAHQTCVKVPSEGLSCREDVCGARAVVVVVGGALSIIPISHSSSAPEVYFLIKDIGGLSSSPCVHNKLNGVSFEQSKHLFSPSSLFTSYP